MPDRHDGRAGLEGEAHEALAEALQLVALVKGLVGTAGALGKDDHALFAFSMLTQFSGVPTMVPMRAAMRLTHGSFQNKYSAMPRARRGGFASRSMRHREHHPVVGELAGVVRDDQDPPGRDVGDAVGFDAEVVAVEDGAREQVAARLVRVEAVGVEAVLVQLERRLAQALLDLLLEVAHPGGEQLAREVAERASRAGEKTGHGGGAQEPGGSTSTAR